MPHRLTTSSPQTPCQDDPDANLPVTRGEFRTLRDSVLRIERGMFGQDHFEGKGMVADHHDMKKKVAVATRLAWLALLGVCGTLYAWITAKLQGKVP